MPFEQWFSRPIKLWLTILSSLTLLHVRTNQMNNGEHPIFVNSLVSRLAGPIFVNIEKKVGRGVSGGG